MSVVDLSPIKAVRMIEEPTPIKVEEYVRNERLQEKSLNNDFSLSDVAPKNLDPVFLNLEETNEFEMRIQRNKELMDQLGQITKRDMEYRQKIENLK
jgi:hypothetical protein